VFEGNPLKSEPWTWLWGEINPQRLVADQTVEGVRNAEDGRRLGWDPVVTMLLADAAMRDGNPKEGARDRKELGGLGRGERSRGAKLTRG
jgi:hypothetical protein